MDRIARLIAAARGELPIDRTRKPLDELRAAFPPERLAALNRDTVFVNLLTRIP